MSHEALPDTFYQDDVFNGTENRDHKSRTPLTPEGQILANIFRKETSDIRKEIKKIEGCGPGCGLGEMRDHMSHVAGTAKELGGAGGIPVAINKSREHFKAFEEFLQNKKVLFKTSMNTLIRIGIGVILGWIGLGFWQQFKMGM